MAGAFDALWERLDRRLVVAGWHGISVPTSRTRRWLRGRRLAFIDPDSHEPVARMSLDRTADVVISRYATQAAFLGGAAGLGGLASIGPEVAVSTVGMVRLAQRLCVVYGFDPETDRGQMALWRALAHGYDLDLPESGLVELKASDLPGLLLSREGASVSGTLTRAALRSSAYRLAGRISRFLPLISAMGQASTERGQFLAVGGRMKETLGRLAEIPESPQEPPEDAIEL